MGFHIWFIYLFGFSHHFQNCIGHITKGSFMGRGNQHIQTAYLRGECVTIAPPCPPDICFRNNPCPSVSEPEAVVHVPRPHVSRLRTNLDAHGHIRVEGGFGGKSWSTT